MPELPDLDDLRAFAEGARLLNFRAAARAVAVTPAAFGQRIQKLEEQLGVALFHRTTRKVVLTEAGLRLLPAARDALTAAESCLRAGRGDTGPAPAEITVGTRHELGMSFLLPALSRIRAAHPGLTVHLYFGSGADLLIRVRTLEIDCAIGSMRLQDPRLDAHRLHREEYVLVASPALARRFRAPADAARHTLIDTHAELPLFGYFRDAPRGGPLPFRRYLHMGTIAAVRALALRGDGVAMLPLYLVAPDLRARRLRRLLPRVEPLADHFRLFFRADDPRRSLFQALASTLLREPLR